MKKLYTRGIIFSLVLVLGAAAAFTAPRTRALGTVQDNSSQSRATRAPRTARSSTEVTSTNRHTACKLDCEEKYSSCVNAKKAKGWSDDRAEKTCGLAGRTCKAGCDRR